MLQNEDKSAHVITTPPLPRLLDAFTIQKCALCGREQAASIAGINIEIGYCRCMQCVTVRCNMWSRPLVPLRRKEGTCLRVTLPWINFSELVNYTQNPLYYTVVRGPILYCLLQPKPLSFFQIISSNSVHWNPKNSNAPFEFMFIEYLVLVKKKEKVFC